jgi:hypothetical protein
VERGEFGRRCKERDRETEMDRERGGGGREEGGGLAFGPCWW